MSRSSFAIKNTFTEHLSCTRPSSLPRGYKDGQDMCCVLMKLRALWTYILMLPMVHTGTEKFCGNAHMKNLVFWHKLQNRSYSLSFESQGILNEECTWIPGSPNTKPPEHKREKKKEWNLELCESLKFTGSRNWILLMLRKAQSPSASQRQAWDASVSPDWSPVPCSQ